LRKCEPELICGLRRKEKVFDYNVPCLLVGNLHKFAIPFHGIFVLENIKGKLIHRKDFEKVTKLV
jgi:hypothetical protein